MAVGEHEAIAVGPDRIVRIEAHDAIPEGVDEGRQRHRRAGMSRLGLLDRINRQRANGVDAQLIDWSLSLVEQRAWYYGFSYSVPALID